MYKKIKKLQPVQRNVQWWQGTQSIGNKISYYYKLPISYGRYMVGGKKSVNYLGDKLHFDNPATPLSMMYYPHEISQKILSNLSSSVDTVLDIGGNIGQFSITYSKLSPHVKIDVLEPNPEAYKTLVKNTEKLANIKTYNYGVSKPGTHTLYVTPGKSSIASFISSNAGDKNKQHKMEIKTINDIPAKTGRKKYDLVKIDVEGYEYEVLNNLKDISAKFLFIEVTALGKEKDYKHSALFKKIESLFGPYDVLHVSSANSKSTYFDMLLRFN